MTIRNKPSNYSSYLSSNKTTQSNDSGFTKEQLILINLKDLAQEYLEIEQLKQRFAKTLIQTFCTSGVLHSIQIIT